MRTPGESGSESGTACCGPEAIEIHDNFGSALFAAGERDTVPAEAVAASLGCGKPTAVADLREGERVLDLGLRCAELLTRPRLVASAGARRRSSAGAAKAGVSKLIHLMTRLEQQGQADGKPWCSRR
ncbi:hypothetical protein [Streptomyces sp. NPDC001975]